MKRKSTVLLLILALLAVLLLAACGEKEAVEESASDGMIASLDDLAGRKVGVLTGSVNEIYAEEYIPGCELEYFNSVSDLIVALQSKRIDAFMDDQSILRYIAREHLDLATLAVCCPFNYAEIFPKTEAGETLRGQFNAFLVQAWADGTMEEIDRIWFEGDESLQTVDLSRLTGENGTLRFAVSSVVSVPFVYVKDGEYVGYEIDIAARFCEKYGYDLEITDYDFAGLLAAVQSGKADFGGSSITETEERSETVLFSEPTYYSGAAVEIRAEDMAAEAVEGSEGAETEENTETKESAAEAESAEMTDAESAEVPAAAFAGKSIGVLTGSIFDQLVEEYMPDSEVVYLNTIADMALALDSGKVAAYIADKPLAQLMFREYEDQCIYTTLESADYAYLYPKDSEKSDTIREQMNEYLAELRADGSLEKLENLWFGTDESVQVVDYDGLTGENGTLRFGVCSDVGAPFAYVKDGEYAGYDVDIAVRFCRQYGYGIEIVDSNLSGLLASVSSGKCDFGGSTVAVTEERMQSMNFSDPNYLSGIVLVTEAESTETTETEESTETEETEETAETTEAETEEGMAAAFAGKSIGVITGSIFDQLAAEYLPDSEVVYYNSAADMALALDSGKVDGYIADKPMAQITTRAYENQCVYAMLESADYAYFYPKDSEKSDTIREQMNEYLAELRADGTLEELESLWFGTDESAQVVDYDGLTGENGTLRFGIATEVGAPFAYVKDGQYAGYDVDIAVRFCRQYGYGIEIEDSAPAGMLASVSSGKCDFGGSTVAITEERKQTMDFSDPNYEGGIVLVTAGKSAGAGDTEIVGAELAGAYAGKKIGVMTGSVYDQTAEKYLPDSEVVYYNTITDLAMALEGDKVDAYLVDAELAKQLTASYTGHAVAGTLESASYGFAFAKGDEESDALREKFNTFIEGLQADGTMEELEAIWFGTDESVKTVDMSALNGGRGTLCLAVSTDVGAPFAYLKDSHYTGFDIDLAARFCRAYGYGLEITDSNFSGLLASVSSGKCDFGASSIVITDEREETMSFSEPYYEAGTVLVTKVETAQALLYEALRGIKIGVVTGMICDQIAEENIPDCTPVSFNSNADIALALDSGKVDAYMTDQPIARLLLTKYPDQQIYTTVREDSYGYIFPKGSNESDMLRAQMNAFLQQLRDDGTLQVLDYIWFGTDEKLQVVDTGDLTGENGTLRFATSSSTGAPFCYVKDGQYVGYDIDIAVRFCREYGYDIEIVDSDFSGMIAAVSGGKCDFGGSCITITEERKQSMNFSDPNYEGGLVIVTKAGAVGEEDGGVVYEELQGARVALLSGSIFDQMAQESIPECETVLYNSNADVALALDAGKVDCYMCDQPVALLMMNEYPDQSIYAYVSEDSYAYIFPKGSEESDALREQMNEFLQKLRSDGTLQEIRDIWLGEDEKAKTVDYSGLTAENGVLRFAGSSTNGAPFCYVKDEQYVGYDIDIAVRFCREYGYGIEITDNNFGSMIAAVSSGKCDFGGSGITVTEERKLSMNFSDPIYDGGVVIVTKAGDIGAESEGGDGFFASVRDSFQKTFLREDRWKLFAGGIGVTVLITVLSAVLGSLLGFGVFLVYRKNIFLFNGCVDVISNILGKTPVVVILMILYYIVFGKAALDGMWVSVIAFSLLFACAVTTLMKTAVGAIDKGQREAALALGYTDTHSFLRVIFPQALRHFLPGYKSELVGLIKSTAIVGYIAVQDLTKVSDIVRSRTYEAFFPLIASAVIYFAVAWLLTLLVGRIQFVTDPTHRKAEKILKGIQTK